MDTWNYPVKSVFFRASSQPWTSSINIGFWPQGGFCFCLFWARDKTFHNKCSSETYLRFSRIFLIYRQVTEQNTEIYKNKEFLTRISVCLRWIWYECTFATDESEYSKLPREVILFHIFQPASQCRWRTLTLPLLNYFNRYRFLNTGRVLFLFFF